MMGRRLKADKGHLEKITRRVPMTVDALGGFARMDVHWLATGVSGQNEVFITGGNANATEQFA